MSILKINMVEEASLEFRLRRINKTINYLLDNLMSEKYKKTKKYLNYVENLLILASKVTGCVSIIAFASLVAVLVGITSYAAGIIIYGITISQL